MNVKNRNVECVRVLVEIDAQEVGDQTMVRILELRHRIQLAQKERGHENEHERESDRESVL